MTPFAYARSRSQVTELTHNNKKFPRGPKCPCQQGQGVCFLKVDPRGIWNHHPLEHHFLRDASFLPVFRCHLAVIDTHHPPLVFSALTKLKLNKPVDCLSLLHCRSPEDRSPYLLALLLHPGISWCQSTREHSINNTSPLLSTAKLLKSSFSFTTHSLFYLQGTLHHSATSTWPNPVDTLSLDLLDLTQALGVLYLSDLVPANVKWG